MLWKGIPPLERVAGLQHRRNGENETLVTTCALSPEMLLGAPPGTPRLANKSSCMTAELFVKAMKHSLVT